MIKVRVPATSANIGPGFDCLGLAVNLYNNFYFEEIEKGLEIYGCEQEFSNEDNLVYKAMKITFDKIGYKPKGIKIKIENEIPISRGLGSSAACIVAGMIGANELAGGLLGEKELVRLATEIEGHPDNVVPALIGGMTVSVIDDGKVYYSKIDISKKVKLCALIPNFRLSTEKSRAVLPRTISFADGVYNVGRAALLISSLVNGNFENIATSCQDKLHQAYRGELIDGYKEILEKCQKLNSLGVFLSGAGPTIMVMVHEDNKDFYGEIGEYLTDYHKGWEVKPLVIDIMGVQIQRL